MKQEKLFPFFNTKIKEAQFNCNIERLFYMKKVNNTY